MLKRLHLRNFTVFEDADFEFGPGLNVIVGANGTGKSHVLKAGYSLDFHLLEKMRSIEALEVRFTDRGLQSLFLDDKLRNTFQPNPFIVSEFIRRQVSSESPEAELSADIVHGNWHNKSSIILTLTESIEPGITPLPPDGHKDFSDPVFVPAKEVLTLGWLLPLYDRREIPIDQTYPDLLRLLMGPPLRQPEPAHIVAQLQQLIGGKVEEEGGHFYLSAPEQPRMEMNLVAEGVRKFATLYKLLANGTLTPETTLFWDEPEANLNPALLKEMAAVLTELAKAGFQIILATHSLFLLKELHILAQQEQKPVRYFGLSTEPGEATTVATADSLTALPNLVALDIEMAQSDIFLNVLNHTEPDADV
jgi:energy-coupling factor transporter ATP-binding protein EcfA2